MGALEVLLDAHETDLEALRPRLRLVEGHVAREGDVLEVERAEAVLLEHLAARVVNVSPVGAGSHGVQARLLGLSSQDLAQALNTVLSGVTATQMRSGPRRAEIW